MGTWEIDAYGNDTAADWAWTLDDATDYTVVNETLDRVLNSTSSVEAGTGEEGIAAAEAVARALGKGGEKTPYTESVDQWVTRLSAKPDSALQKKAVAAVDKILTAPSELLELWQETDSADKWKTAVLELRAKLA